MTRVQTATRQELRGTRTALVAFVGIIVTSQAFNHSWGHGSMMAMVTNMARIVVIVTAATSMSIFGGSLQTFLAADGTLGSEISRVVGGTSSPISGIDANMAETQVALAAIYKQARTAVYKLNASLGRASDLQSDQLAASLVVAAKHQGMTAIDTVVLSEDDSHAFALQGRPDSPLRQIAFAPTAEAVNTPLDKSSAAAQSALGMAR